MNTRIHDIMRTHAVALAIALAMGLVYASHHFFIPLFFLDSSKEIYEPLAGDYGDEALLYGPRAHDAFLHFGIRGDFSLAEYPRSPAVFPMLNPLLLGGLGKIFGSIQRGIIASDILFPSLIFFILYLFMCEAGTSRFASVFFSTLFIMSPQFGISIPPVSSFHLRTLVQTVFPFLIKNEALYFSHFDEPKLTFIFFILFLYMAIRALKYQNRRDVILAGISFGILFYTYLYDWATAIASLGLAVIYFFIAKDYRRLKIIAVVIAIGICVSSYYWINLLMLKNLPAGQDVIARLGGEFSHQLRFATVWKSYIRAVVLVIFLWTCARTRMKEAVIVISALLLGYIIAVNAQIVTGFNIQPDHWYRVQYVPIAIAVYILLYTLWKRYGPYPITDARNKLRGIPDGIRVLTSDDHVGVISSARLRLSPGLAFILAAKLRGILPEIIKKYASLACAGFFIYFFSTALAGQYAYSRNNAHLFSTPIEYHESFEWLNRNTEMGSVVGTLSFGGNLHLQMRTANHIFTPFGLSTIASEDELMQRFMIMAKLWGVDGKGFVSLINEGGAYYLFGDQYGIHTFDAAFFPYSWHMPNDILAEKTNIYETTLMKKDMLLSDFRLDYLFVDRKEFPHWKEPRDLVPLIAKVFDNGRVGIYSVR